ncbi:MAG: transglycosylase domain-containing protein, partial [Myxococcales bacterium]|nr:transglycosylase domain-containing protein [Myxococcales bacterium]
MARPDQSAADQQASRSALENQPTLASVPDARGHSREETISGDAPTMLDVQSSAPRPRQRSLIDDVARAPKDFPSAPALKSKKSLSEVVEAEKSSRPPLKRRLLKWTKRLVILLVLGALLGVLAVVGTVEYYSQDLPSVADLRKGYDPPQVTKILAKDGTELASLFTERRTVISLDKVPDHVKLAFLAAEDARFYEHEGLNYVGMLRALVGNPS